MFYLNFLRLKLWDEGPAELLLYQKALKANRGLGFQGGHAAEKKLWPYIKKLFKLKFAILEAKMSLEEA